MTDAAGARPNTVLGRINYHGVMTGRPQIFAGDYSRNVTSYAPRDMEIRDGSARPTETDLDREGFRLVRHHSTVTDFADARQYDAVYKAEVATLLRELTGADHISLVGGGAIRRSARADGPRPDDQVTPVHFPHIDASDVGIHRLLDVSLPDRPQQVRRWAFYNTWRQLSEAPVDEPLAVCDARTIAAHDLVPYESHFPRSKMPESFTTIESLMLRHNDAHRWTFFSRMSQDDLLIFKTNDSDPSKAHFVPHTAFYNTTIADPTPRTSIELRAYACWF